MQLSQGSKTKTAKVVTVTYNMGELPTLEDGFEKHWSLRTLCYRRDNIIESYPLLWCDRRIHDSLEMNLFLEHRFRGKYCPPKHGGRANPLGGVTTKTIRSISNSLCKFLSWLEVNKVDWREVTAYAATEKAKYWLPVYRFRRHLIDCVVAKELSRDSASLCMNHIRQFYEWALKNNRVEKLPFKYKKLVIKKKKKDGSFDLLFTHPSQVRGIIVQTSDLTIPKKYRQKNLTHDGLTPFDEQELARFYNTDYMKHPTRRLWADLALQCGFRAMEVAGMREDLIVNPQEHKAKVFHILISGKGNKEREVLVPRALMYRLWQHMNDKERLKRALKWDLRKGTNIVRPFFLNRSGLSISVNSVTNVTVKARMELKKIGRSLDRTFHDLRSTYATNFSIFMLEAGLDGHFIEYKLMMLLGHANFSTTRKYLNFARSVTFDRQMKEWTDQIFTDFEEKLRQEQEVYEMDCHVPC